MPIGIALPNAMMDVDSDADIKLFAVRNLDNEEIAGKSQVRDDVDMVMEPGDTSKETIIQDNCIDVTNDAYFYTKRAEFTSEVFKVEVKHIPKHIGYNQLKKRLKGIDVEPVKIKFPHNSVHAFMTFRSEEERENAIERINGHEWKKQLLTAKKALPTKDPSVKKRQLEEDQQFQDKKRQKTEDGPQEGSVSPTLRIVDQVTPLWKTPYSEQLRIKVDSIKCHLNKVTKTLQHFDPGSRNISQRNQNEGLPCPLNQIIKSPVIDGYRNKVEFNVGLGPNGKDKTVGFRLGSYASSSYAVVEPKECVNVSKEAKLIAEVFQHYITESTLECFDPKLHTGYWKQLTVKSCRSGEIMAIVQIHPQGMNDDEKKELINSLKDALCDKNSKVKVNSLFLQIYGQGKTGQDPGSNVSYEHISGEKYIHEGIMDLKFRISPDAFFQVNTPAAELLYQKIKEWCKITTNTTLLDICCGTGTIGLTLAKSGVRKVIGIEMCQQAVEDAKHNAELNGITNATFVVGKAENVLPAITNKLHHDDEVVAVVDPPRAGLHKDVVRAIRQCSKIKRLIYVSCSPSSVVHNLADFIRSRTKRNKGEGFRLIQATPVDLFPHTKLAELVLLFERVGPEENQELSKNEFLEPPTEQEETAETEQTEPEEKEVIGVGPVEKQELRKNEPFELPTEQEIKTETEQTEPEKKDVI